MTNQSFKDMSESEIINQIKNTTLDLRDTIGLNPNMTFGTEIEFENIEEYDIRNIRDFLEYEYPDWKAKLDDSLHLGLEINSPVLSDDQNSWRELGDICEMAQEYGEIAQNSGAHIHFGAQSFKKPKNIIYFLELWALYEKVIFKFSAGEEETMRYIAFYNYAAPLGHIVKENEEKLWKANSLREIKETLRSLKSFHAVNLYHLNPFSLEYDLFNTIEIRSPNGTLNPVTWQNNINFFGKMIEAISKPNYDAEKIRYKLQKSSSSIHAISDIDSFSIKEAAELADTVFTDSNDKKYFLKQTLKI